MLKKVLLVIGGIIVLLLLISLVLPSKVHVERSLVINAPASKIFNEVNSLQKWSAWDPWQKMDPAMTNEFSGPESGVGNKNTWKSEKVGDGSQVITESVPNEKIESELDFGHSKAKGSFTFVPEGSGTKVVWAMDSETGMNPMARYMGLMMDGMVGGEFEKGLNNLKAHVEGLPDEAPPMAETPAANDSVPPATN